MVGSSVVSSESSLLFSHLGFVHIPIPVLYGVLLRLFCLLLRLMGVEVFCGVVLISIGLSSESFHLNVAVVGLVGVSWITSLLLSGLGEAGGVVYLVGLSVGTLCSIQSGDCRACLLRVNELLGLFCSSSFLSKGVTSATGSQAKECPLLCTS